jgi:hypothetical protein
VSTPYERLLATQQAMSEETGIKPTIKDLLVLAPDNDPFRAGTPTDVMNGEWFAEVWGDLRQAHLRRAHYAADAQNVPLPGGGVYQNDKESWIFLNKASRAARYLGLVDVESFVDRRNPSPHVNMEPGFGITPEWSYDLDTHRLNRIRPMLANDSRFMPLAKVETDVRGYFYEQALQPYLCEVWAEKTTMNDILVPLCRQLGANFVSGAGYQSITSVAVSLLKRRVARLQKPTRILYISDYDPAGRNMPRQVGRQLQFWLERYAQDVDISGADIRLEPIVLTAEQAEGYPTAPDSDSVELDALEVYSPGRLRRIVRQAVSQFRDPDLRRKVAQAEQEAQELVEAEAEQAVSEDLETLENIKAEAEEIYARYRPALEALAAELNAELEPLDRRVEVTQQAMSDKLQALRDDLHLPEMPEGEPEDAPEDEGWLFDSSRDAREQLRIFKER